VFLYNLIDFFNDYRCYTKHVTVKKVTFIEAIEAANQKTPILDEVSIIFKDLPEEFKYIE
jgi:hypothetical protein